MREIGRTIAVLGGGFFNIYPKENIDLYKEILNNEGCIISEYAPDVEPNTLNFPKRNRIIAGIAMGTLVVEAAYRSGSSITAKLTKVQHKPVFCIPSNINSNKGIGTNRLIQQGATLVMKPKEILDKLGIKEINKLIIQKSSKMDSINNIPIEYRKVYELIQPDKIINIEKIKQKLLISMQEINTILSILELDGYIKQLPGNNYLRVK